jgi:hypothetical protein
MKTASVHCEAPAELNVQVRVDGTGWLPFGSMVQSVLPSQPLPVQPPPADVHPGPVGALSGITPLPGQPTPTTCTDAAAGLAICVVCDTEGVGRAGADEADGADEIEGADDAIGADEAAIGADEVDETGDGAGEWSRTRDGRAPACPAWPPGWLKEANVTPPAVSRAPTAATVTMRGFLHAERAPECFAVCSARSLAVYSARPLTGVPARPPLAGAVDCPAFAPAIAMGLVPGVLFGSCPPPRPLEGRPGDSFGPDIAVPG